MYVKTISYVDYFGQKQTRDFRFHLTDTELFELEYSVSGGFTAKAQQMYSDHDSVNIFDKFKDLILRSYGEISEDGQRFVKSKELSTAFSQTPAFDIMFQEICTSDEAQEEFITNVLPGDREKILEAMSKAKDQISGDFSAQGIEMK